MSYCVNCGVELDASATKCPLCDTPVYNPKAPEPEKQPSPFPKEKGQVEVVKRKDLGVLLTVIVLATAVTCGLLNAFVFRSSLWSLAVIGIVLVLWVIMIPVVIYTRQPIYLSILLDGVAVIVYLYLLTYLTGQSGWFYGLGLPIVLLVTAVVEAVTFCMRRLPMSFLTGAFVSDLRHRRIVCGTGASDRQVLTTGDRLGLVCYCADHLRDCGHYHRNPFISEKTAQCSEKKTTLLITIQSHEILARLRRMLAFVRCLDNISLAKQPQMSKQQVNLLFRKASEMRFCE